MPRPANSPFTRPPAKSTRSSTSDIYVAPEFRSTSATRRAASTSSATVKPPTTVTPASSLDVFDSPATVITTTTTTTTSTTTTTTMQNLGEGTSTQNVPVAPVATAETSASAAATAAAAAPATAAMPTVTMMATGYDATLAPPPFRGSSEDDGEGWLARFEKYVTYRGFPETEKLNLIAVLFRDQAADWWDTLEAMTRNDWNAVKAAFKQRFQDSDLLRWQKVTDLWNRRQGDTESVDAYVTAMQKMAKVSGVQGDSDQLRYAIQRGLKPELLAFVIQSQPSTVPELVQAARVAEAAAKATAGAARADPALERVTAELAANREAAEQHMMELRRVTNRLAAVNTVERPRTPSPQRTPPARRVTFAGDAGWEQPTNYRGSPTGRGAQRGLRRPMQRNTQPSPRFTYCGYCGGTHERGQQFCRAANVTCFVCNRRGHLARVCRAGRGGPGPRFPGPYSSE